MKFQLLGPWPVGAICIPVGTEIDGNDPRWQNSPLPLPMPIDAMALDQEAYDAMALWYPDAIYLLQYAPDVQPKRG